MDVVRVRFPVDYVLRMVAMLRHAIKRRGNIFEVPGSRFLAFL